MGYRAILGPTRHETVQELMESAKKRLEEARSLKEAEKHHSAIYLAGLSAEMYLKTTCLRLHGARPPDPAFDGLASLKNKHKFLLPKYYENGHGLKFWSQVLLNLRGSRLRKPKPPKHFHRITGSLYSDWFVGMRYRPGSATSSDADRVIVHVQWLAANYAALSQ